MLSQKDGPWAATATITQSWSLSQNQCGHIFLLITMHSAPTDPMPTSQHSTVRVEVSNQLGEPVFVKGLKVVHRRGSQCNVLDFHKTSVGDSDTLSQGETAQTTEPLNMTSGEAGTDVEDWWGVTW